MLKVNLGTDTDTTVEVRNDNTLHIKKYLQKEFFVDICHIRRLYVQKPVMKMGNYEEFGEIFDNGFVYVSLDGDIKKNPLNNKQTFLYTRWHKRDIAKFVQYLQSLNEDIEVIHVKRHYNMHKDRAVKESRANPSCPSCYSANVEYMGNQRKSFSVKKALIGGLLTGGVGAVAGFAGKKGQDRWHCVQCGLVFQKSPR